MLKVEKEESIPFLDSVYTQYRNLMIGATRMYISDIHLCEDIVHNAFICLIRNEKSIRQLPPARLKAYVLLAVRHASIDWLRREGKAELVKVPDETILDFLASTAPGQEEKPCPFRNVELYALLQQLSAEDQTLLIGRYIVGLDGSELASLVGCSTGNLRVRLHRAIKRALELFTSLGLSLEDFLL